MKRPAGVILTGITQILGSLLVLLLSIGMLLMPTLSRNTPSATAPPTIPPGITYGVAALYGFFAVLGFLTAIGLLRVQNWARYSTLIFSGLLVVMGLIMALIFAVMPMPPSPAETAGASPNTMFAVKLVMAGFALSFALLGAIWLYYFNRASTKAAFQRDGGDSEVDAQGISIGGRRVPMSIAIIGGLQLLGGVLMLPMAFWTPANVFLGVILTGWTAKLFTAGFGLVAIYVGVALWRLSNSGRLIAIAVQCVSLINVLVMVLMPHRLSQYMSAVESSLASPRAAIEQFSGTVLRISGLLCAVMVLIILYFLVTRAYAFRQPAPDGIPAA
jgi:hypothetical protein